MRGLGPAVRDPELLVGFEGWDDAAVYRLGDELALVQTVDFFPPIVDDPHDFGAVAAANALSDVYAMGGKPLTALAVVGFPKGTLPLDVLTATLAGAQAVLAEAGAVLAGGHTIKDAEFKFGLAVTGTVHPARIVRNAGAQVGDRLLLTKPLGTGILSTAMKRDRLDATATRELVAVMRRLNRAAAAAMVAAGAHAATDVTGYGLLGHGVSMARESGVTLRIRFGAVPLLAGARELLRDDVFPGGLGDNRRALAASVRAGDGADPDRRLLFDPQTSGGLLVSLAPAAVDRFQAELARAGQEPAAVIGEVVEHGDVWVEVVE